MCKENMEERKIFLKKIFIIIIILIIVICSFIFYKKDDEFLIYNEDDDSAVLEENELIVDEEKNLENIVEEKDTIKIYITGEVKNPGVKELKEGSRIEDAINIAGGLTDTANISQVNLAYSLEDGQKIYIPNLNEKIDEYISMENGEGIVEQEKSKTSGRININKADVSELCELPGVGESLAKKIVDYREENGKFKTTDDLKNVTGIGEKKFESIKEYIVVK